MKISDSEMKLMELIWKSESEVTSSYLTQQLGDMWKPTTVMTFLKRLSDKGFLNVKRSGKTSCYTAAISEDEYKAMQTAEFVKEIHHSSLNSLLASLCGGEHPDRKKIENLKKMV